MPFRLWCSTTDALKNLGAEVGHHSSQLAARRRRAAALVHPPELPDAGGVFRIFLGRPPMVMGEETQSREDGIKMLLCMD